MAYHQFTITVPDELRELISSDLWDMGCLGIIEAAETVIVYFPGDTSSHALHSELDRLIGCFGTSGSVLSLAYTLLQDQNWNSTWKAGFKPLDIGERFTILPPWEERRAGRINLVIDPGMAFGTGHHETTRSCLVLMEKFAGRADRGRFLDLGTGTGLLAIAALRLGYHTVVAVDTDGEAIEAARKNLELNGITDIELIEGDISLATGTFELIAANLISGALIGLAGEIASHLEPSGIVILSGILREQGEDVVLAMSRAGLALRERLDDGKWASLVMARAN